LRYHLSREVGIRLALLRAEASMRNLKQRYLDNQEGKIGYVLAWLMGVPASVLFAIFLLRGCN
jgi:hypothetical protein